MDSSEKDHVIAALSSLQNIEEIYEVAGEYDIVSVVSTFCLEEFRDVLQKRIMKIKGIKSTITEIILQPHKGVKSTVSSIVLKAHKGPKCNGENI